MDPNPKSLDEIFREYAMTYFEIHADQRLRAFQFFITLATAIIGGFMLLLRYGQGHKWMSLLGLLLTFLSFVFWKLDVRTRKLVKNAEDALKYLDARHDLPDVDGAPHPLKVFARDEHFTNRAPLFPLLSGHFSYSRAFRYVFVVFGLIGLVSLAACLLFLPS